MEEPRVEELEEFPIPKPLLFRLHNIKGKDRKAYQITSRECKGQRRTDLYKRPNSDLGGKHTLFYKVSLVLLSPWSPTMDTY